MASRNPIVLIHGYSDRAASFDAWKQALIAKGHKAADIHVCSYVSLSNEVTIKDIAEGFDRALRQRAGLGQEQPFDAIVHSTGMLVIRAWLSTYASRRGRLKRLVALAPATFGSPLAHKGRGFLGAVFKGNRLFGPDFLEAGDQVLDGLELASRFTWDLTHQDLLTDEPYYSRDPTSPYVFILCGIEAYGGLRRLANEPGTDGTVRWAGCSLNTQKITIDLSEDPGRSRRRRKRVDAKDIGAREALPMPFWPIAGKNHGSIVKDPGQPLIDLVAAALEVSSAGAFEAWTAQAKAATDPARADLPRWQQFVVRVKDEREDPVRDYFIELFTRDAAGAIRILEVDTDVHAYSGDPSFRCFHVNLDDLQRDAGDLSGGLSLRLVASSGSALVGYHGIASERIDANARGMNPSGVWDAMIDLPATFGANRVKLFFPFTTTFVEVTLNRDPMPFATEPNGVTSFV